MLPGNTNIIVGRGENIRCAFRIYCSSTSWLVRVHSALMRMWLTLGGEDVVRKDQAICVTMLFAMNMVVTNTFIAKTQLGLKKIFAFAFYCQSVDLVQCSG